MPRVNHNNRRDYNNNRRLCSEGRLELGLARERVDPARVGDDLDAALLMATGGLDWGRRGEGALAGRGCGL